MTDRNRKERMQRTRKCVTLLECIVYTAVLAVVLNMGTVYMLQARRSYERQQAFLDQSVRAVQAGRRIKKDIEDGTGLINAREGFSRDAGQLIIRGREEKVIYKLTGDALCRISTGDGSEKHGEVVLSEVDSFVFREKREGDVVFAIIDIRLEKPADGLRAGPVFTFKAVPGRSEND